MHFAELPSEFLTADEKIEEKSLHAPPFWRDNLAKIFQRKFFMASIFLPFCDKYDLPIHANFHSKREKKRKKKPKN